MWLTQLETNTITESKNYTSNDVQNINQEWEVTIHDVKAMLDKGEPFVLLDVREKDEYAHCRIEGAHLVPMSELGGRIDEVRRMADGKTVITQCHHGGRSFNAAVALRKAGIEGVKSMAGGIDAWSLQIDTKVPRY